MPHENININPSTSTAMASPALTDLIKKLISEAIENGRPTVEDMSDEIVTNRDNLNELDKIPDLVKCLRDFSGNHSEYTAWRKSVDRIFELYGHLRGSAKYFGILSTIRNKIIGQANTALESYNTPLNWKCIKECLNSHYADKRDISTLEYQLTMLIQGNKSIDEFYQNVYSHFSLILNKISSLGLEKNVEFTFVESYRNKALDTFVRGLNGDLARVLAVREPKDLPEALFLCNKLANQNYRTNYAYNSNQKQRPPLLPPKPHIQYNRNSTQPRQFYPQLTYFGRPNPQYYQPPQQKPFYNQHLRTNEYTQNTQMQNQPQRPMAPNHNHRLNQWT